MASICDLEPFLYDAVPVPAVDPVTVTSNGGFFTPAIAAPQSSASSTQLNEQKLELYLKRFLEAVCDDLTAVEARLDAVEDRLDTLEDA